MIGKRALRFSCRAVNILPALFVSLPWICAAQTNTVEPLQTGVTSNPRGSTAAPRFGLKPGLYDAGRRTPG
jgi:hypothetical protein